MSLNLTETGTPERLKTQRIAVVDDMALTLLVGSLKLSEYRPVESCNPWKTKCTKNPNQEYQWLKVWDWDWSHQKGQRMFRKPLMVNEPLLQGYYELFELALNPSTAEQKDRKGSKVVSFFLACPYPQRGEMLAVSLPVTSTLIQPV